MSEDDILSLISKMESGEDVPDIPESSASSILIRMWAMDRAERRRWHRTVKIAGLVAAVLAGGGGIGVVRSIPVPAHVVVPAPIETVALSVEDRLDVVEPRVQANEGSVRHLEELMVEGIEWAGDAMSRKRGTKVPDFRPRMKGARDAMDDRRKVEAQRAAEFKRLRMR